MHPAMRQTAAPPPGEDHCAHGRYSNSAGARGAAPDVIGGSQASSHSDERMRMARTKPLVLMNAMICITAPQFGSTAFSREDLLDEPGPGDAHAPGGGGVVRYR